MNNSVQDSPLTLIEMGARILSLEEQIDVLRELILANNNTLMDQADQLRSLSLSPSDSHITHTRRNYELSASI